MTRRVRVGYADHPPFSFTQPNGCPSGESWAIAHTLLTRLGITIEPVETDFWSLIPQLGTGYVDVVASGLLISKEREKEVAFTHPTYQDGEGVLLHRRNPHRIRTFQDIVTHPQVKVAAIFGSLSMESIRLVPPNRRVPCIDTQAAIHAIISGQADCFVASTLTLRQGAMAYPHPDLRLRSARDGFQVPSISPFEFGALAVRKTDIALRNSINALLDRFIGSTEHAKLVKPFGFGISELPSMHPHFYRRFNPSHSPSHSPLLSPLDHHRGTDVATK